MWPLWFVAVVFSLCLGLIAKYGARWLDGAGEFAISWIEFAIVISVAAVLVIPITTTVGLRLAKQSKLTYHEFWSGYETAALKSTETCTRDSGCRYVYNCDPYDEVVLDYDSKGNVVGSHTVTHYHSCPYVTIENHYKIETTLGDYGLGLAFDANPVEFRPGNGIPSSITLGDPPLWAAAKHRLDIGDPGPVTADKTYDNYVLASTRTILHRYSDAVETNKDLLPDPVKNWKSPIHDHYYADKMTFIGIKGSRQWQDALARFNAALGTDLQGDLHVVAISAPSVNPDEYAGAVNAWWQDKHFGKRALSKNGIGVIIGVTKGKVAWARAFTGMPVGNNALVLDIQSQLTGVAFTPETVFGKPVGVPDKDGDFTIRHTEGAIEQAVWGPHKFVRVCMVCDDKGESGGGYKYLAGEIAPSTGMRVLIVVVSVLLVCLLWGIALFTEVGERLKGSR